MTGTPGQTQHVPRRRSALRRWLAPIACLLIGMVLSIVSGWVCILAVMPGWDFSVQEKDWMIAVPPAWPARPLSQGHGNHVGWTRTSQNASVGDSLHNWTQYQLERVDAGLPFRSARAFTLDTRTDPSGSTTNLQLGGLRLYGWVLPRSAFAPLVLPFRPLFPGFALNTLICAALTWCILFGPAYIRRRRRLARNQCPACGYPTPQIGTTTTCTECGEPVTPHSPPILGVTES